LSVLKWLPTLSWGLFSYVYAATPVYRLWVRDPTVISLLESTSCLFLLHVPGVSPPVVATSPPPVNARRGRNPPFGFPRLSPVLINASLCLLVEGLVVDLS